MIDRKSHRTRIARRLKSNRVLAILGARQVGKTTLARQVAAQHTGPVTWFDLEDPVDIRRLEDPKRAMEELRGLVVIDEVQRRADLFPVLRVLVDRPRIATRFLVLGSTSPDLLRQSSESLAGRIAYHTLNGFNLSETGATNQDRLWLRGGFPLSYLESSNSRSLSWRRDFARTFLERDLPQLGITIPAETLRRFWTMLAHYHAQIWNASELARAFGLQGRTVRRYLDILVGTHIVRTLPPYYANLRKRQVKAPKIYLVDGGLLHMLLGIKDKRDLLGHPKVGASWEGFALEQIIQHLDAWPEECFFWATHAEAEIDLLVFHGRKRLGFEFKNTSSPGTTRSMHTAIKDLELTSLTIIHPGDANFSLTKNIRAVALRHIATELTPLRR